MNWFTSKFQEAGSHLKTLTKVLVDEEEKSESTTEKREEQKDATKKISEEETVGISKELIEFVSNIALHPSTFLDFPEDHLKEVSDDLLPWQEKHARLILEKSTPLRDLRFKLCPSHLKDNKFWKIYFVLIKNKLGPHLVEDQPSETHQDSPASPRKLVSNLWDSLLVTNMSEISNNKESTNVNSGTANSESTLPLLGIIPEGETSIEQYYDNLFKDTIEKTKSVPNSPFKDESIIPPELDNYFVPAVDWSAADDYEDEFEQDLIKNVNTVQIKEIVPSQEDQTTTQQQENQQE